MALLDCTFEAREYMIRRDAREEGREEEREKGNAGIYNLVRNGKLSLVDAAESLSISVEELQQRLLSVSQE